MQSFLKKSGIVVMLISGLETYAAIYVYTLETHPKYRPLWKRSGLRVEREKEIEKKHRATQTERIKSPTYHRCFCKPFDPQGAA